jgi:hypothetical protein
MTHSTQLFLPMVIATHGLRVVTYVMLLRATIKLGVVPTRGTVPVHFYKKSKTCFMAMEAGWSRQHNV